MSDTILNIVQGDSVSFGYSGIGDIVGYSWEFPGGNPTGATADPSPNVLYTNVGLFDVSLTTEDAYGVFDTDLKTKIINVDPAPWEVDFTISESPVLMGISTNLTNISIGSPNYNEWTFPTDGIIASGVTASSKISINGLRYMNWLTLTGSHSDPAGTTVTSSVKLFASSDFALGSKVELMNIRKLGPEELYRETYDYDIGDPSYMGEIYSTVYGSVKNKLPTVGATSIGLTYSYVIDPQGINPGEYKYATYASDGSVIYQVNFGDSYVDTYWSLSGLTGPTGLFNPHVEGEKAEITGRAFSSFNVKETSYVANNDDVFDALGGASSGKTIGDNINNGKYTSDIKSPAPALNEIVNPNFALVADNYKATGVNDFDRSYLTYYVKPVVINTRDNGASFFIPKPTIDKLFEHPIKLPNPGTTADSTIGITTSADIHLSSDQRINSINEFARSYVDTSHIRTLKMLRGATNITEIGRYPAIPSQYLLPYRPSTSFLNNRYGPVWDSSYPPMSLRMNIYYAGGKSVQIDVYFGLPDVDTLHSNIIKIPAGIDPDITGGDVYEVANAYGNDVANGSWILAENNGNGLGVIGYINAYIKDSTLGLPNGTDELIAKVDDYYTLPTPYSDNLPGTIISGSGPTPYPGISIEIKNPEITKVELVELYGMVRQGGFWYSSFYDPDGDGDPLLMSTPTTWDFGRTVPAGQTQNLPPYIGDPADWMDTPSSYLGISSRIVPFSSGPLGYGNLGTFGSTEFDKSAGIKIGGELKT